MSTDKDVAAGAGDESTSGAHRIGVTALEQVGSPAEFMPVEAVAEPAGVDGLSLSSLYLKLWANGQHLGTATGFIVQRERRLFFVTNWHVLAGRRTDNEQPCHSSAALPDQIRIAHHAGEDLGRWRFVGEPLYDERGRPRRIEHPRGRAVDVAALELSSFPENVRIYALSLKLADAPLPTPPGTAVSVIGFPRGLRPNVFFGVWKTGHIASDVDIPYQGQAAFLIDATTHKGMSGSPVVARQWINLPAELIPGQAGILGMESRSPMVEVNSRLVTKFLGIYSGRIQEDVEIGCVWRPSAITEVSDHAA